MVQSEVREDWRERLEIIVETMREMSRQQDPTAMVQAYGKRMENVVHRDRMISLSRRGHTQPEYRVTRDSAAVSVPNPWKEVDKQPRFKGGLFAELIYADEPRIIDDLQVAPNDPAAPYVAGYRSLVAIPLFDQGISLNMVIFLWREAHAFDPAELPQFVWMSNLFGRATHNLVLSERLREAYEEVDQELAAVESMQRALLPEALPGIPRLDLAVHYQTSRRAGGDYYDFFPLPDERWGILVADVSGHGTPAAVLMAITHSLAHTQPGVHCPPAVMLTRLNEQLARHYTSRTTTFVTAFYGIFDPRTLRLTYALAGHPPPRLKRCADGSVAILSGTAGLPLGVVENEQYHDATHELQRGDQIVFYTDGITEAFGPGHEMFGTERLDRVLEDCSVNATSLMDAVLRAVAEFTNDRPPDDDRTCLIAKVT